MWATCLHARRGYFTNFFKAQLLQTRATLDSVVDELRALEIFKEIDFNDYWVLDPESELLCHQALQDEQIQETLLNDLVDKNLSLESHLDFNLLLTAKNKLMYRTFLMVIESECFKGYVEDPDQPLVTLHQLGPLLEDIMELTLRIVELSVRNEDLDRKTESIAKNVRYPGPRIVPSDQLDLVEAQNSLLNAVLVDINGKSDEIGVKMRGFEHRELSTIKALYEELFVFCQSVQKKLFLSEDMAVVDEARRLSRALPKPIEVDYSVDTFVEKPPKIFDSPVEREVNILRKSFHELSNYSNKLNKLKYRRWREKHNTTVGFSFRKHSHDPLEQ